jgi:thioesterase domain-containing protein
MTAPATAGDATAARPAGDARRGLPSAPNGVRLERLRPGRGGETLFIVPGLEGDPAELGSLASAFTGPQEVYAVAPLPEDAEGRAVATMERMAELMVTAIRRLQPSGPYRLGGYSFGGLVALEVAQQLRAAGAAVEALFLIEAVYDERYWPRGIWLRALIRRTGRQLRRIARMRPAAAVRELRRRGLRLVQRVIRRNADRPDPLRVDGSDEVAMLARAYAATGGYRPRFYDGSMTLIASSVDRHFGCDTVRLWKGYAAHLAVQRVNGDHLTVMHEPASAVAVAGVIDHRLTLTRSDWAGLRPSPGFARPMILTTMRWFSAARLAHALTEAGFLVSACRPGAHALEVVDGLTDDCRLNRLWRTRSLVKAIRQARPDVVLPDDEQALALLRRLHARTRAADPEMAALIAHSLGKIEEWPSIISRPALADVARTLDIPSPLTAAIDNVGSLRRWAADHELPIVLKTDGSWGGRGVAIVREAAHIRKAWRTVSSPPPLPRALKRTLFNLEAGSLAAWARRTRPVVSAQQFVEGREAIATVACVDGEVRAVVCLEVIRASAAKGPAAVVRIIDHPAATEAARRLVRRFGLSGFCGFDFIITDAGDAQLLELNARLTPTCHLLVEGDHRRSRTIALFPAELVRTGEHGPEASGVLDLPVRAPWLIHRGERMAARRHRPVNRMARRVMQKLSASPF